MIILSALNHYDIQPRISYNGAKVMKLFIIHAGYYDDEIGIYELHTNFLITAKNINELKSKVMNIEIFKKKNMHIDAVQEIDTIGGYKIQLIETGTNDTILKNYDYTQIKQLC